MFSFFGVTKTFINGTLWSFLETNDFEKYETYIVSYFIPSSLPFAGVLLLCHPCAHECARLSLCMCTKVNRMKLTNTFF